MQGSELTYAGNCFTAGYVVGQMPAVMLATKVRPSILIPTLEIMWSVLTICTSSIKTTPQLYAIRFLIGLCESGYFPVMIVGVVRIPSVTRPKLTCASISLAAGTQKKNEASALHCSIVLQRWLACSVAICKLEHTRALMVSTAGKDGNGFTSSVASSRYQSRSLASSLYLTFPKRRAHGILPRKRPKDNAVAWQIKDKRHLATTLGLERSFSASSNSGSSGSCHLATGLCRVAFRSTSR